MSTHNLQPDAQGSAETILRFELQILELLFDDVGLAGLRAQAPKHPAVTRYEKITTFLDRHDHLEYPNETDLVLEIGSLILDGFLLVGHGTDIVGAIEREVLHQLRARVTDREQFSDQMAALSLWGMLRSKGIPAKIIEQTGLPDILLPTPTQGQHWIEVKRIRLGTSVRRIRKNVKDANDQIKRASVDGVGSLYVFIERPQQRVVFDDAVPAEVQAHLDEVERELHSGHSKSVAEVIVSWDDYMLVGEPPEISQYFVRRRSIILRHRTPRSLSQLPEGLADLGRTVMLPIVWAPRSSPRSVALPSVRQGAITATELFRRECEATGDVRSAHAIEVVQHPDAIRHYELGGHTLVLATKRISLGHTPYTLLVIGTAQEDGRTDINLAFRLYDGETLDAGPASNDPLAAFTILLECYGTPVTVGGLEGLLIPRATVHLNEGQGQIVEVHNLTDESFVVSAFVKLAADNKVADVAWAFAVLTERYRAAVRRHQK